MQASQTPLLTALLDAQDDANKVVSGAQIETHARRVIDWASQFQDPTLISVGDAAHRLLGAVTLLAHGALDIPVFAHRLDGRNVLLVGTVASTLIEFEAAAANVRRRGATGVHGCATEITRGTYSSSLDSFTLLSEAGRRVRSA